MTAPSKQSGLGSFLLRALAAVAVLVLQATAPAMADSQSNSFEAGLKAYNKHDNYNAYMLFRKFLQQAPDDALCRYYLANTLANLKHFDQAVEQYRLAYWLSHDPAVSRNCKLALDSARQPVLAALSQTSAAGGSARPVENKGKGRAATLTSSALIGVQADREMSRLANADRQATEIAISTTAYADKVERDADSIDAMYTVKGRYGTYMSPEAATYSAWEHHRAQSLTGLANEWSSSQTRLDNEKMTATRDSAASLQSQLQDSTGKPDGSFKLLAGGTNLYVRNFAVPHEQPQIPLVAIPQSLSAATADHATAGRLPSQRERFSSQRKVRALLLDPKHRMEVGD